MKDKVPQKAMGSGAFASIKGGGLVTELSDGCNEVHWTRDAFKNLIKFAKETEFYDAGDNDKGAGGKADYLTVDTVKMAEEIVTSNPLRGALLAQELYARLGWEGPQVRDGALVFYLPSTSNSDKLQPEVPVDTGRSSGGGASAAPESGSFEDHYPR